MKDSYIMVCDASEFLKTKNKMSRWDELILVIEKRSKIQSISSRLFLSFFL